AKHRVGRAFARPDSHAKPRPVDPTECRMRTHALERLGHRAAFGQLDLDDFLARGHRRDDGDAHAQAPLARRCARLSARITKRSTRVSMMWPKTGASSLSMAALEN